MQLNSIANLFFFRLEIIELKEQKDMDLMDQIVKGVRNILIKETAFFFLTTFFFFNMN